MSNKRSLDTIQIEKWGNIARAEKHKLLYYVGTGLGLQEKMQD